MNIVRKLNRSVDSLKLQGLKVSDIVSKLKNKFREYFITVEHHKTITTGFSITAYHHCEKQKSSLFVCSKSDWRLKKKEYYDFKFEIVSTILHEQVHNRQFEKRLAILHEYECDFHRNDVNKTEDQNYYGNPDEIEAYANDIILELSKAGKVEEGLRKPKKVGINHSNYLYTYYKAFKSFRHPDMKRLLKECYKIKDKVKWET